jgi:hypothetical protein
MADLDLKYDGGRENLGTANSALEAFSRLKSISLQLPESVSQELKIWVHQITAEGEIGNLPATSTLTTRSQKQEAELSATKDQVIASLDDESSSLEISL